MSDDLVELEYYGVLAVGPLSKLFDFGDGIEAWIPLSEIEDDTNPDAETRDDVGTLSIPLWLAQDRGLDTD